MNANEKNIFLLAELIEKVKAAVYTKKLVLVLSDSGNVGKTFTAKLLLDNKRMDTKVAGYVADVNHQGLYKVYGEKDKTGKPIPIKQQNPMKGIAYLDLLDSSQDPLYEALGSEAEIILVDLPANITEILIEQAPALIKALSYDNIGLFLIPLIKDNKSVQCYAKCQQAFPTAHIIPVLNKGWIMRTETKSSGAQLIEEYSTLLANVPHYTIENAFSDHVMNLSEIYRFREIYVPRDERRDENGNLKILDSAYPLVKNGRDKGDLDDLMSTSYKFFKEII